MIIIADGNKGANNDDTGVNNKDITKEHNKSNGESLQKV